MTPELFLCATVITATATDLASRRIPNIIPLVGLLVALALQLPNSANGSAQQWLTGALTGLLLFLPFYMLRGMAAGDVKLMAAVGAFVGPMLAVKIGILTFIIGGFLGIAMLVINGRVLDCARNLRTLVAAYCWRARGVPELGQTSIVSVGGIPYALAIGLSTLTMLYWERL